MENIYTSQYEHLGFVVRFFSATHSYTEGPHANAATVNF